MSSVGIFGVQFNGWYEDFLPGWFDACLAAQPDEIVLVSDRMRTVPAGVTLRVVEPSSQRFPIPYFSNAGVEALGTDWCWNMDVDDRIRSNAMFEIRVVDAEVYCAGLLNSLNVAGIPKNLSCKQVLDSKMNLVNAGSAFKKWLWADVGGYPDLRFHDWGLWRRMARAEGRFVSSGCVLYDYRMDPDSASQAFHDGSDVEEVLAI